MFKGEDRENEIDKSSPRFKARGNTSLSMSNPFGEPAKVNNFIITPERMRNLESPDNAFKNAHVISKAKAQRRSRSREQLEIDIQSPNDNSKIDIINEESEILYLDVAPIENPFISHNKNQSFQNPPNTNMY